MSNRGSEVAEVVADKLRGKKIVKRVDVAHSASEATEIVNQELELKIENPDHFSELRNSIEEAILEHLNSRDGISLV